MNLGFSEMLFIFLLAMIIFGPKKLPEIGRTIGKALNEFKRASNDFKSQLESEMRQIELEEVLRKEKENLSQILQPSLDTVSTTGLGYAASTTADNPATEATTTEASSSQWPVPADTEAPPLPESVPESVSGSTSVSAAPVPESTSESGTPASEHYVSVHSGALSDPETQTANEGAAPQVSEGAAPQVPTEPSSADSTEVKVAASAAPPEQVIPPNGSAVTGTSGEDAQLAGDHSSPAPEAEAAAKSAPFVPDVAPPAAKQAIPTDLEKGSYA